ncbi:MAG: serine hydrolase domain-containing protein [Actinomycetota bacterium]
MMRLDAAFEWARTHVEARRLPTAVLGVATSQGTVALEAFGDARTDDRYPLFSITKPLVGIAVARAIERGLLTPETPLTDALPDFGRQRDDVVRLRHLASHTSGISEPALDTAVPLRRELLTRGRDFPAGTMSRYSTLAFEGIAALIEHATGSAWDAEGSAWAAQIGADGLSLDAGAAHAVVDAAALGFDTEAFVAGRNPGAGLVGRADDLLRLGSELLRIGAGAEDGILRPATLAMMRRSLTTGTPRLDPFLDDRGEDWGFTWNLRSRAPGLIDTDVFGHSGWAGTEFWVHPSADLCWVLLTNRAERPGVDADALDNAIVSGR